MYLYICFAIKKKLTSFQLPTTLILFYQSSDLKCDVFSSCIVFQFSRQIFVHKSRTSAYDISFVILSCCTNRAPARFLYITESDYSKINVYELNDTCWYPLSKTKTKETEFNLKTMPTFKYSKLRIIIYRNSTNLRLNCINRLILKIWQELKRVIYYKILNLMEFSIARLGYFLRLSFTKCCRLSEEFCVLVFYHTWSIQ